VSWVETSVPCMLYCGPELCNCPAYYYYEGLEEDDDWSIADRKALAEKRAYARYLSKVQGCRSSAYPEVVAEPSKVTYILSESGTAFA